jgi:alpha-tubulin suppressor-like RCC1 family protein
MTPEWGRFSRDSRKIRLVVAGRHHSLLLTETGELFGCGDNSCGQLGLGDLGSRRHLSLSRLRLRARSKSLHLSLM